MRLWAAAVALTAFLVGPVHADDAAPAPEAQQDPLPSPSSGEALCEKESGGGRCIVNRYDLEKLRAIASSALAEAQRLKAENDQLRGIKGCAKITVERRT